MSLRRGGTPLALSSAPPPTLEASNQAQITDLVQRNRTLEHTVQKLTSQLTHEQSRSASAILAIQHEHTQHQSHWKTQCADVLRMGRIVTRMAEVETEKERAGVVREMGVAREEKLERLRRDYRIKLFQMREEELEREAEVIEEERGWEVGRLEAELAEERERAARLAAKVREAREGVGRRLEDADERVNNAVREREDKEAEYNALRKEHVSLETKLQTLDTKFQRTRLQLEGAQTKLTELERANDDMKRTNANLTNQIERWENLETKGDQAAAEYQKRNRELEAKVLEAKEEREEERERFEKELAKEKKRAENLKASLKNWEIEAKAEKNAHADLEKQLVKLQKLNEKQKADFAKQKERLTRRMRSPNSSGEDEEEEEEDQLHEENVVEDDPVEVEDEAPPEPVKKPTSKKSTAFKPASSSSKAEDPAPLLKKPKSTRQIARKSTGSKPPPPYVAKKASSPEVVEISDREGDVEEEKEEEPAPTKKKRGKAKAAEQSEVEEVEPPKKQKGKRKAVDEDDEADIEIVATKKGGRAASELKDSTAGNSKAKGKARAGSKQPSVRPGLDDQEEDEDDGDKAQAVKKKKRKIIPSVTSGPGPFAFGSLNLGKTNEFGGLNIPSMLSPLKQDEHVPQRSTSAALHGLSKLRR